MVRRAGKLLDCNLVEVILLGVLAFLIVGRAPEGLLLLFAAVFILQLTVRGLEYAAAREAPRKPRL